MNTLLKFLYWVPLIILMAAAYIFDGEIITLRTQQMIPAIFIVYLFGGFIFIALWVSLSEEKEE